MRKILTILMLLALTVPAWAGEKTITITRNDGQYAGSNGVYYYTKGGVTMSISGGMNNPNFLLLKHENTISFKSANYAIKEIIFHCLDNFEEGNNDVFYWGPTTMNVMTVNISGQTTAVTPGKYTASGYDGHWVSNFSGTWTSKFKGVTRNHTPYANGYPVGNSLTFESMGKPIRFSSIDIVIEKETGDMYELVTSTSEVNTTDTYMLVGRNSSTTTTGYALSVNATGTSATDNQTSTPVTLIDNGLRVKTVDDAQFVNFKPSTNSTYKYYIKTGEQYLRSQTAYQSPGNYNNGFCLTKVANANDNAMVRVEINESGNTSVSNWEHFAEIVYQFSDSYKPSGSSSYYHYAIRHNNNNKQFRNLYVQGNAQQVYLYKPSTPLIVTSEVKPESQQGEEPYGTISLRDGILVESGINYSQKMDTIQFLATPKNGYKIKSVTIQEVKRDNNTHAITEVVGNVEILSSNQSINGTLCKFVMPANGAHIIVEFEEVQYHNVNIVIDPDQRCGNVFLTEGYVVQNDQVKSYDGQNVVFNVTPNLINIDDETEGYYELKSVTVTDDITGQSITYNLSDGNYNFTMPDHDVTITATFKQNAPEPLYLLGTANGGYWTFNNGNDWRTYGPVFNYNKNIGYYIDVYFKGTGEYDPNGNTDNAYGFFSLSKRYADNQDWGWLNGFRLVAHQYDSGNEGIADGETKTLYADTDNNRGSSFRIPAGIYRIVVDKNMTQVTVTRKDLSLNFDPAGGNTIDQPVTVSPGTNVSLMGSLYNVIQSVNSNIITPENTPLYHANHDDANFKYKAVKTIGENSTTDGPTTSTTILNTTLDVVNEGETVTELKGWNYLGWIVAENTDYYKVISTPLHWIEENGEKNKTYTVSDRLQGVYAQGGHLWCKDLGDISIVKTKPNTDQVDYLAKTLKTAGHIFADNMRIGNWDQSNWVELDFSGFGPEGISKANSLVNHYIKAKTVTGVYSDDVNYTITLTAEPEADGDATYVPNTYCTSNFIEENLKIGNNVGPTVNGTTYYFLNPKIQEYAIITFAMWDVDKQIMVVPGTEPFNGAACIGRWDLNEYKSQIEALNVAANGSTTCYNQYEFHIIVQRENKNYGSPINASKADTPLKPDQTASAVIRTQPLDLQVNNPLTAITTVGTEAQVVGVEYVNIAGMRSSKPWQGINIVVTRYSDGSTTTTKVVK